MSAFVCQASFLFEAENIQNNPINVWPQKEKKNTERGSIQPRDISKAVYVSGGKDKIWFQIDQFGAEETTLR